MLQTDRAAEAPAPPPPPPPPPPVAARPGNEAMTSGNDSEEGCAGCHAVTRPSESVTPWKLSGPCSETSSELAWRAGLSTLIRLSEQDSPAAGVPLWVLRTWQVMGWRRSIFGDAGVGLCRNFKMGVRCGLLAVVILSTARAADHSLISTRTISFPDIRPFLPMDVNLERQLDLIAGVA
ncbi:hypothetical protein CPC735_005880 [Coccidioides posadasii C735 delta SOWgp]|uniref:Uncharacterized protein n=1 Tax=Coccidioides posadasii (strain C735) TaxID=222929 RepID=C5P9K4_COCP7|nr:hypothetical protein CPC735_005880 [Coccidioides posadasii C735 delta SOWgp]EER26416.1 hypothetical protein CPC735_005880 [Coccidioides posadasii C735 delta SOWgp]|eukprot:XP_003068561.1 hypothetical protein CPC735_005880 [Coccidioides posadasii C735 delta SOWgp]